MNNFEKKLKSIIKETRLTTDEKNVMRERIHDYMQHLPARNVQHSTPPSRFYYALTNYRTIAVFLVATLMFSTGAGVTFAAESALPGESLYPIKEVTEEVRAQFIRDDGKRAQWAIERVHRRIEEAQLLAEVGELNEETAAVVEDRFVKHAERAQVRLEHLHEQKPILAQALQVAFTTGAEAQVEVLEDIEEEEFEEVGMAVAELSATPSFLAQTQSAPRATRNKADRALSPRRKVARLVRSQLALVDPFVAEVPVAAAAFDFEEELGVTNAATAVDPAVTEELVKVFTERQARLEKRIEALSDERKEELHDALEDVREHREDIIENIQEGNYNKARKGLHDAIRATHKTDAAIKIGKPPRPFPLPEPEEDGRDLEDL